MSKRLNISVFALILSLGVAHAQVISLESKREQLIEGMHATLGNADQKPGDYSDVQSPFVPRKQAVKETINRFNDLPTEIAKTAERLPDAVALKIVGERFAPIGSLVLGNRGILQLANGEYIEAGEAFPARIQGNVYEIKVIEVTSQGYTLRLGEASIRKNFITTNGATQ